MIEGKLVFLTVACTLIFIAYVCEKISDANKSDLAERISDLEKRLVDSECVRATVIIENAQLRQDKFRLMAQSAMLANELLEIQKEVS